MSWGDGGALGSGRRVEQFQRDIAKNRSDAAIVANPHVRHENERFLGGPEQLGLATDRPNSVHPWHDSDAEGHEEGRDGEPQASMTQAVT